jgi:hypothetical protein
MTTTIDIPTGLDEADLDALVLAMKQCRASSGKQAQQLDAMLDDRAWQEVAEFAAYTQQADNLRLRPWQMPPCCVADENEPRVGEESAAKLLRRMLKAGISRWHPDPMRALEEIADFRQGDMMPTNEPRPLALTDEQLNSIMHAATPLHPVDRSAFLATIAQRLQHETVIGDGLVHRVVRDVLREGRYQRAPVTPAPRHGEDGAGKGHHGRRA